VPISQKRLAKVCQKVIRGVQLFGINPRAANLAAEMVDMQKWQWLLAWLKRSVSLFFRERPAVRSAARAPGE